MQAAHAIRDGAYDSAPYNLIEESGPVDCKQQIREQFAEMFTSSGLDAREDIAALILNQWGHAFVNPEPGFYFGRDGEPPPPAVLRDHSFGRIAFAHCDLTGFPFHPHSIQEGQRAMTQLLPALGSRS
jgi:spermidine dehydrogenase